jgi:hypothetical protein
MALRFTQSLTEMSTRSRKKTYFGRVKSSRRVRLKTSPPSVSRLSKQCGILNISIQWASTVCYGDSLTLFLLYSWDRRFQTKVITVCRNLFASLLTGLACCNSESCKRWGNLKQNMSITSLRTSPFKRHANPRGGGKVIGCSIISCPTERKEIHCHLSHILHAVSKWLMTASSMKGWGKLQGSQHYRHYCFAFLTRAHRPVFRAAPITCAIFAWMIACNKQPLDAHWNYPVAR